MIFRPELADKVLAKEKTETRRRMSDKPRSPWFRERCTYDVGQVFSVQPGRGKVGVGLATIREVRAEPLSALTPQGARAEGFTTRDAFIEAWRAINGAWDPDEIVWVIVFELCVRT